MKAFVLGALTGHGPLLPLLALLLVGAVIFLLASRLARRADAIAAETGLGGLWVGSVLLAGSTSLPEVLTGFNAAWLEVPDIGVGDVLGATLVNMLILAVLDIAFHRRRILHHVAIEHALVGLLGLLLTLMVGVALLTSGWGQIAHVGVETIALAVVYLGAMRLLYRSGVVGFPSEDGGRASRPASASLRRTAAGFALAALGLAAAAPLLVLSAEALALEAQVSQAFVGALLVGLGTTFPEMAATLSAVRMGALDLAVGNVFGSNAFNILVLLIMDVTYGHGPVLAAASRAHLLTVLLAATCVTLALMAIVARAQRRPATAVLESLLIVLTYLGGAWLLYAQGSH